MPPLRRDTSQIAGIPDPPRPRHCLTRWQPPATLRTAERVRKGVAQKRSPASGVLLVFVAHPSSLEFTPFVPKQNLSMFTSKY